MLWYVIIFSFCIASWIFISYIKDEKAKRIFEVLVILILAIFAGTRFRIGGYDYFVYERVFNNVSSPSIYGFSNFLEYGTDFLYYLFNSIIKSLGFNFYGFTLIESLVFHLLLYRGIKKNKIDFGFFIIIFLYKLFIFNTFVSMRQSLVLVLFFNSIPLIKDRKRLKYIIIMLLASFIHSSAIILIPLAFVDKITFSRKMLTIYSIVFFILFLLNIFGIYCFNPTGLISTIFSGNNSIMNKIEAYSSNSSTINVLSTIETYAITIFIIIFYKNIYKEREENKIFINIFLLIIPIVTFFRSFEVIIRFRDYFTIAYPFVLYYLFKNMKGKDKLIVYSLITIICFAGYYRYIYSYGGLVPYKSYIFEDVTIFLK